MSAGQVFVTAINCMDGRTQLPVIDYMLRNFHADFVDTITDAGPCEILASQADPAAVESILKRTELSTGKHGSKVIAIIGHFDCQGNPAPKSEQVRQLEKAKAFLSERMKDTTVVSLWIDERWEVSEV